MAKVSMSTKLPASAKAAWDLIGGFNGLPDWHPVVEKSELEGDGGSIRRLSLLGGGTIVEKLEKHDDGDRTYSYTIEEGPLPVSNYRSTISVSEGEGDCTVEWSSEFDAAVGVGENDAIEAIQGVYQAGLDNLKKMFGG
jgi:hypothetical protein